MLPGGYGTMDELFESLTLALLRVADDPEDVVKIIKEAHTDLEF